MRSNLRGGRQIAPWLGIYAVSRRALRWNLASIAMATRRDAQAAALLNFKIERFGCDVGRQDVNLFTDFAIFEKLAAVYFIARSVSQSAGMAHSSIKFIG